MSDWLSQVFSDATRRSFEKGERLFHTGDRVLKVFWVLEGQIDLVRVTPSGNEMVLQSAGHGTVLAEASVYSESYHCDAVARSEGTVAQLGTNAFKDRLATNRIWAENWAGSLAHSVQRARLNTEIRSLKRVADRLDFWLAVNSDASAEKPIKDIAAEIGVSPEALYRELAKRRRRKV
ncbi:Crp/Fnr family transcriptional regulator [Roseibium album]|uniref:Crp/Fnr family transcriptional regulator n=1 Tax=Roseibium album TaxID=311410 RepID=UPI00131A50FC|nr:CRP-like cAMP-binding protein [Labrenzia sp. EL_142]